LLLLSLLQQLNYHCYATANNHWAWSQPHAGLLCCFFAIWPELELLYVQVGCGCFLKKAIYLLFAVLFPMQATLGAAAVEAAKQAAISAGPELPALPAPPSAADKPGEKGYGAAPICSDVLGVDEDARAGVQEDEDLLPDYDSDEPPY
jgi:hypothetical protein